MSWHTKEQLSRYRIRMFLWKTNWRIKNKVKRFEESGLGETPEKAVEAYNRAWRKKEGAE